MKKMPGVKVVEEEKVPETDAVEKTMESMINLDGATLLFPTSFGYYNPHMIKMANKFPKLHFEHCGGLWTDKDPEERRQLFRLYRRGAIYLRHRRRLFDQDRQARLRRRQADPAGAAQHQCLHARRQARQPEGHHAGDLHRRLVDAGQGSRGDQQPDRPGRRCPDLPRRRPEDDGRERGAARRDGLRLSRQPVAAGAEGLSDRRRVELGSALSEVREDDRGRRGDPELLPRRPEGRDRQGLALWRGGLGGSPQACRRHQGQADRRRLRHLQGPDQGQQGQDRDRAPAPSAARRIPNSKRWTIWSRASSERLRDIRRCGSRRSSRDFSGRGSGISAALRRDHRIHPHSGRGAGRRARRVRDIRRACSARTRSISISTCTRARSAPGSPGRTR